MRYEPLHSVDFLFPENTTGRKLAFITDVGNDIAYAQPPLNVVSWVERLVSRLQEEDYQIFLGGIPTKSLASLNPRLFNAVAKVYYAKGAATKDQVTRELGEVEIGLQELCEKRKLPFIDLEPNWYSYDHFHLKRGAREIYWRKVLEPFPEKVYYDPSCTWSIRRPLCPQKYWLLGRERHGRNIYRDLIPFSLTQVR